MAGLAGPAEADDASLGLAVGVTSTSVRSDSNMFPASGCFHCTRFLLAGYGSQGTVTNLTPLAVRLRALCAIWIRVSTSSCGSITTDRAAAVTRFRSFPGSVRVSPLVAFFATCERKICWRLMRLMSLPSPMEWRARTYASAVSPFTICLPLSRCSLACLSSTAVGTQIWMPPSASTMLLKPVKSTLM